jgi:hypothetical protein
MIKIIYDNDGYVLSYNMDTKTITEYQDKEIISESNEINSIQDITDIENCFYADWRFVGFEIGAEENKFFNTIKKVIQCTL